ncbi:MULTISPECIES: ComEA family DNA-binding protein [Lentisalinibacter]|jgi:competence protein ComEA|uniref:ComEA family DNA-binding protein n=1 Tax=Lentisalinibacter TaxID=3382081 RepID=UPI002D74DCE8|nr:helix-hairpin-helix domain-containing protein [Woeseiaceae bacterium]
MTRKTPWITALLAGLLAPLAAVSGPVNVNTADAETIAAELDGIGIARARAIVAYRQANGPFRSVDDLLAVKGVGERILAANRDNIRLAAAEKSAE